MSYDFWKDFRKAAAVPFVYLQIDYPFLHFSIVEQFIVRVASKLSNCYCWRNGILISKEPRTKSAALIQVCTKDTSSNKGTTRDRYLQIEAHGPNKEVLLANIRQVFQDIRHFSEEVVERLSLDGATWVDKSTLEGAIEAEVHQQDVGFIKVADFRLLLQSFELLEERKEKGHHRHWLSSLPKISMRPKATARKSLKVFVSYAKEDKQHLEDFKKQLAILTYRYPITAWDDSHILAGDDWEERTQSELEEADIAFFLISADFLSTAYKQEVEIAKAVERHKEEADTFRMVPIVVRSCPWELSPLGKVQSLPKNGKILTKGSDKDLFWTEVSKGIQELLEELSPRITSNPLTAILE